VRETEKAEREEDGDGEGGDDTPPADESGQLTVN